jgi:hypothetical protein
MKIPKELKHYADWVFVMNGTPQEETIERVIEGCKIFIEKTKKEAKHYEL